MTDTGNFTVSIIVPCFNEVDYVEACLKSALAQEDIPGGGILEVLVADGMSDDGTRDKIVEIAAQDPRLHLIENPARIVPAALNLAIRSARGEIIVRMDAHTEYAPDYVKKCLEVLAITDAENVGGPARTKAKGYIQQAIRLAYHSPFSVGGAKFHNENYSGYVDTVTYGCWRRQTLEEIGLFDESLMINEDDELNLRIVRRGGRIWQSTAIRSWYYPRDSVRKLFWQYVQYGYWKVRVIQKHKIPASLRHLVPCCFLVTLLILALLATVHTLFGVALIAIAVLYVGANLTASIITCRNRSNLKYLPMMPFVFGVYHFGYGYGFLHGLAAVALSRLKRWKDSHGRISDERECEDPEAIRIADRVRRARSRWEIVFDPLVPYNFMLETEKNLALVRWIKWAGLAPVADKKLLEVGCGNGPNLLRLMLWVFGPKT